MTTTEPSKVGLDAVLMLPDLSPSICHEIAQLANPSGLNRFNEERLQAIRSSLQTTGSQMKFRLAQSTRSESQDILQVHEALKAAAEVIELLHQTA